MNIQQYNILFSEQWLPAEFQQKDGNNKRKVLSTLLRLQDTLCFCIIQFKQKPFVLEISDLHWLLGPLASFVQDQMRDGKQKVWDNSSDTLTAGTFPFPHFPLKLQLYFYYGTNTVENSSRKGDTYLLHAANHNSSDKWLTPEWKRSVTL